MQPTDSIPLAINALRQGIYHFKIDATKLHTSDKIGFLKDKYLGTETRIHLEDTTLIVFTIDQDPASKATDRFLLLFKLAEQLSVEFIRINATRSNNINTVQWNTAHEKNIDHYSVQFSENGRNFNDIAMQIPTGNNASTQEYNYLHIGASAANMYYRIVAHNKNGQRLTSDIAKVSLEAESKGISIYPNPVTNNTFTVFFNNDFPGKYYVSVSNINGEELFKTFVNLPFERTSKTIQLPTTIASGTYLAKISNAAGEISSIKLVLY